MDSIDRGLFRSSTVMVIKKLLFIKSILIALSGLSQSEKNLFVDGRLIDTWNYRDTLELSNTTRNYINDFWANGYLFSDLDSINQDGVYVHKGEKIKLRMSGEETSHSKLLRLATKEVEAKINNGYPFTYLTWDSIRIDNNNLTFKKAIVPGPFIANDSIILLSPIQTKHEFIAMALGIKKGEPFSEKVFRVIPDRLNRVSFLESNQKPDVSFQDGASWTYLDLTESKTGSFEGVLGVLPNQSNGDQMLITGNINLSLMNLFRSGKELDFSWQRFAEESQELNIRYKHPFVLSSDLHFEGNFGLIKQDTSFVNQKSGIATSLFLLNKLEFGMAFDQLIGTVITTNQLEIVEKNYLDFQQTIYSISLSTTRQEITEAKNNFTYRIKLGMGERVISRNLNLPIELYDTVNLKTTNFVIDANSEFQRMINSRMAIFNHFSLAHQSTRQTLDNQLFRLGGLKTLRGFNEQFFFASSYFVSQLEWRLYFEEKSYLFAFYDQGFIKHRSWESPIGLGTGISLNTNAGLLSFALSVGKTRETPFEFTNMKVHFGYLSLF